MCTSFIVTPALVCGVKLLQTITQCSYLYFYDLQFRFFLVVICIQAHLFIPVIGSILILLLSLQICDTQQRKLAFLFVTAIWCRCFFLKCSMLPCKLCCFFFSWWRVQASNWTLLILNVKVTNLPLLLSFDGEKYNEMVNLVDSSLKSIRYPASIRKDERTE